ncbi:hypothetical protein U1Q18_014080 [Sarracenia purpurea var. burkii]
MVVSLLRSHHGILGAETNFVVHIFMFFHASHLVPNSALFIQYTFVGLAISSADITVVMDKGHVKWVGSSTDLSTSSIALSSLKEVNVSSQAPTLDRCGNTYTEVKENVTP